MNQGLFITFEGGEGSGKSTQARLLAAHLRRRKVPFVHTREPGGTSIAESVRRVLLLPNSRIAPLTELLLYEAARAQHLAEIVLPALRQGRVVICERYTDATVAYQGYGRGLNLGHIRILNEIATEKVRPDLTFLLDVPVRQGLTTARGLSKRLARRSARTRGGTAWNGNRPGFTNACGAAIWPWPGENPAGSESFRGANPLTTFLSVSAVRSIAVFPASVKMTTARIAAETQERPFQKVMGQEAAVNQLVASIRAGRVPHAYLFTGPAGVGKKTAARAWAKTFFCQNPLSPVSPCGVCVACQKVETGGHPDLLWVDFARQAALLKETVDKQKSIKIGTVREMEHALRLKPLEGRVKVALLTPADALGDDAAHALLKIIEEPPPGTHLVLIATEAGSLLPTIRSRCQRVRFRPLTGEVVKDILARDYGNRPVAEIDRAAQGADGSIEKAKTLLEEGSGLDFDWARSPLSDMLSWCEGFQNPRLGRTAAEHVLETLIAQFQGDARAGERAPEDLARVFQSLTRLRQNASVGLTLQHLFIHLRRNAKKPHGG